MSLRTRAFCSTSQRWLTMAAGPWGRRLPGSIWKLLRCKVERGGQVAALQLKAPASFHRPGHAIWSKFLNCSQLPFLHLYNWDNIFFLNYLLFKGNSPSTELSTLGFLTCSCLEKQPCSRAW